jgi:hypothetical protein
MHMKKLEHNCPSHQSLDCLHEAKRQGFAYLTPDEHRLIETLRWTSHCGRDLIYTLANDLRQTRPWDNRI